MIEIFVQYTILRLFLRISFLLEQRIQANIHKPFRACRKSEKKVHEAEKRRLDVTIAERAKSKSETGEDGPSAADVNSSKRPRPSHRRKSITSSLRAANSPSPLSSCTSRNKQVDHGIYRDPGAPGNKQSTFKTDGGDPRVACNDSKGASKSSSDEGISRGSRKVVGSVAGGRRRISPKLPSARIEQSKESFEKEAKMKSRVLRGRDDIDR